MISVQGCWYEPLLGTPPGTTMPRDKQKYRNPQNQRGHFGHHHSIGRMVREVSSGRSDSGQGAKRLDHLRLFSVATRQYLRRRTWRYFRRLGKNNPERYIAAISRGLVRYTDDDVSDGLALIDNWGLSTFAFSPESGTAGSSGGLGSGGGAIARGAFPAPLLRAALGAAPRGIVDLLLGRDAGPSGSGRSRWCDGTIRRGRRSRLKISSSWSLTGFGCRGARGGALPKCQRHRRRRHTTLAGSP